MLRNGNKVYPGARSIKRVKDGRQYLFWIKILVIIL